MTPPYEKIKLPPAPPVLSEVADTHAADIPTLTEIHTTANNDSDHLTPNTQTEIEPTTPEAKAGCLSEADCQHLAAQIAPQVEALLQDAMRDIQAKLPELIRSALGKEYVARQND